MLSLTSSIEEVYHDVKLFEHEGVQYVDTSQLILISKANSLSTLMAELTDENIMFDLLFKNKHEADYFIIRSQYTGVHGHMIIRHYLVKKNDEKIIHNEFYDITYRQKGEN